LIPLPWSAHGEQLQHAQILREAGVGEICEQTAGTANLYEVIMQVFDNRSKYVAKYPTLQHLYVPDAANSIIKAIVFTPKEAL
jgi:UDP-N-acetylglucosamine:LPS N-acetylglucosamine transferase